MQFRPLPTKKRAHITAVIAVLALIIWVLIINPIASKLPENFIYYAEVSSVNSFYDEDTESYLDPINSNTRFILKTVENNDQAQLISNQFQVESLTVGGISSVERILSIDPRNHQHMESSDKVRQGTLFAPPGLSPGETFTYWHVNYDAPAEMQFVAVEEVMGLTVYHYEANYSDQVINQTTNQGRGQLISETRGIYLEPKLSVWVEPRTGRLINYQDNTVAYLYDLNTGERIAPWNRYSNTFTAASIQEQVQIAAEQRSIIILIGTIIPILLALVIILSLSTIIYYEHNAS